MTPFCSYLNEGLAWIFIRHLVNGDLVSDPYTEVHYQRFIFFYPFNKLDDPRERNKDNTEIEFASP
ncbi:MAG: hypothetical protein ABI760_26425 [Ferruginibacter sp.]